MNKIFTKILTCIYGAENDAAILEGAINFGKTFNAEVIVAATEEGERNSAGVIENKLGGAGVNAEKHTLANESVKAVSKMVDELGADLVVVSANHHTQALVNELEVPVLSILKDFNKRPITNIVMPLHDDPGTRQKIPLATEISKVFGATINILVVSGSGKEEQTMLKAYAHQAEKYILEKGGKCTYEFEVGKKVDKETVEVAAKSDADLIIIMNDRNNGWFSKPLSESMMLSSSIPILVVEPKDTTISYSGY